MTPIILATMDVRRDEKHAKILRYARNIWHIEDNNEHVKGGGGHEFPVPVAYKDIHVLVMGG